MQTETDERALLYTLYHDKVFGYVMNRIQNRAVAEDITHEVFLKLYSRVEKIDANRVGASTYIFKVTQSVLYDFYRRSRYVCTSLDNLIHFDETDDLDEMLVHLNAALDTLSPREREIVILHYYDGMAHREIARRMGLSHTNVRQICHVALKKLRIAMETSINGEKSVIAVGDDALASVPGGLNFEYDMHSSLPDELDDTRNKSACGNG